MGFLPTDHAGAADILRLCGRSMAFGDDRTMAPYKNDHRVEIHGTGYSKIIFGEDHADNWEQHLDLLGQFRDVSGQRCGSGLDIGTCCRDPGRRDRRLGGAHGASVLGIGPDGSRFR